MITLHGLLKAIHVLSAVIWVGGMFFAYLVLRPALAVLEPPQRIALHTQVFQRFFKIVWHVMPLILISGLAMIFSTFAGMAGVRWNVHAMLLLGLVMAGVFAALYFGPYQTFRAGPGPEPLDTIRKLIGVNLALGLLTTAIAVLG